MEDELDIGMDKEAFESKEKAKTLNEVLQTNESANEVPQNCGCSVSDIVQDSSWNKRFQYLTQGYGGLPEWYSVPPEEINIEEQQSLLELEVKRLKDASATSAAFPFLSNGHLGIIDGSKLRQLSAMSDQLLHHMSIIEMDNLCAVLHTPRSPKIMRAATYALGSLYRKASRSCSQPTASFDPIQLEATQRYEAYAKLIDYTTSCVARLATRYATGDAWYKTNTAILGQVAVKLKFLARDTSQQAEASLCHAKSILVKLQKCVGEETVDVLSFDEESILESCDDTFEDDYIRSSQARQKFAMAALKRTLGSLNLSHSPWRSADFLQSSSEVYTVGLDKTICAVMKDETSRVSVTSTAHYVNFCRIGLDLVRENFLSLETSSKTETPSPAGAEPVKSNGYSQKYIRTSAKDSSTSDSGSSSLRLNLKKHRAKLQNWKIDNNSITIKCRGYVVGTLLICIAVTLAFVLPSGIQTGDPLPNAYVASIVVGAILFVANNRWTSTWQWHDFLKGRIVCHSVSEVAKVANVDDQLVLLKLLHHARGSRFATQGPYNLLFKHLGQDADSDEDLEEERNEKHSLTRALLSGAADIAPKNPLTDLLDDTDVFCGGFCHRQALQIGNLAGERVLDARKEESVDFMDRSGGVEVLSSLKPSAPEDGETPTVKLSENRLEWTRLLGIYTGDVVFGNDQPPKRTSKQHPAPIMCTAYRGYWQCFFCGYQKKIKDTDWRKDCEFKCTIVLEWLPDVNTCKPFPGKGKCPNPEGCTWPKKKKEEPVEQERAIVE
ncbi:hypothetical protein PG988_006677 [Apiospora saccharicola]